MTVEKSKSQKKRTNVQKLRKLLTTGALSVALISWYTTANGLHEYVFDHIWQAYIISAAVQGALFSLSIKGIDLLVSFNRIWKMLSLIAAWALLLGTSSTFSYVYISGDVYTDILLREDAQRILNTYCLQENYSLNSEADKLLTGSEADEGSGIEDKMGEYVASLAKIEEGVKYSDSETRTLEI